MQSYVDKNGNEFVPVKGVVMVRKLVFEAGDSYKLPSGLIAPKIIEDWIPPQQGEVVAVGDGVKHVAVGDVVLYGIGTGKSFVLDDKEMLFADEDCIIGKFEAN